MVVVFHIFWWNKPLLTEAEEIECGKRIALVGKKSFIDAYFESVARQTYLPKNYNKAQKMTWRDRGFYFLFLGLLLLAIYLMGKMKFFLVASVTVVLMFIIIYSISTAISVIRMNLWLSKLVRQYASYAARETHRTSS